MTYVYKVEPRTRKKFIGIFSINTWIILINIICFILFTILIYTNANFIDYIAIKPSNIMNGDYIWTFFTSMFMHAGFFHLTLNMFSLLFLGGLVEKLLGGKRYFMIYLISGLFAGSRKF